MRFLGIDPGANGAMVFMNITGDILDVFNFKDMTDRDIIDALRHYMTFTDNAEPIKAYIEKVHAMPKQGIASTAKFMDGAGFLRGIIAGHDIAYEYVTPQAWQKYMGSQTKGDKNITKAKAQQLWPQRRWTHANADAALICEYGRRVSI